MPARQMQQTLANPVQIEGRTLWVAGTSRVVIYPAEPDTGIVLARISGRQKIHFPVSVDFASVENHRVVLSSSKKKLAFVEHLLAGLWGAGIDNARVEVSGPELPFLDGSGLPYINSIHKAGIRLQDKHRRCKTIRKSFFLRHGESFMHLSPARELSITYIFVHRGVRILRFGNIESRFPDEIAPARTFAAGTFPNFPYPFNIRSSGRFSYPYPPRYPDEMVRHKVLDLLGDLALMRARMTIRVIAYRSGHHLTHLALKHLLKEAIDA